MKLNTVIIQMSIGGRCIGDAGIHVEDSLSFECLFQSIVQESADSHVLAVLIDIDRSFCSPVVSGTLVERAGVGIAKDLAVFFCDEVWIFFQSMHRRIRKDIWGM